MAGILSPQHSSSCSSSLFPAKAFSSNGQWPHFNPPKRTSMQKRTIIPNCPVSQSTYRSSLKRRPILTVHLSGGRHAASRGTVRNTLLSSAGCWIMYKWVEIWSGRTGRYGHKHTFWGRLQRLHSGLRSACSTGSPHSPSALVLSPNAPAGGAASRAPPSDRSSSPGVGNPQAPEGRGADSPSVRASSCGSMGGVKSQAVALRERRRRRAPRAEERGLRTHVT